MRKRALAALAIGCILCGWSVLWAQKPFREYPAIEYEGFPLPDDYQKPHEFIFGRLKYPDPYAPNLYWSMDYPRSDRHASQGLRRLTRIDTRSVEQVVELDDSGDIYNWPFLYTAEAGHWGLSPHDGEILRDYLARGGFLMSDDFHGEAEWLIYTDGINEILPGRTPEDISDNDPIFHVVYDLEHRVQVPGWGAALRGRTWEREDGKVAHWRGVQDDRGRWNIVMTHNMDLGDAWEHSDDPQYPEQMASVAYRILVNYVTYTFTH